MKNLFLLIVVILVIFSQIVMYRDRIKNQTVDGEQVPVLYWTTDPNPVRIAQIAAFTNWLKKNDYPMIDLRVDAANQGPQKIILQSVTGVASDLIDIQGWPTSYLGYFHEVGFLEDLTGILADFKIRADAFFKPVSNDLFVNEKVFGVSANSSADAWVVNLDIFVKLGVPTPPIRWTMDEFEKYGRDYVKRANQGKKNRDHFLTTPPAFGAEKDCLMRSVGVSYFNETLSAGGLDNTAMREFLKRSDDWIYEDHIMPTGAEMGSFNTAQGYGGPMFYLFTHGNLAMISSGTYLCILMRQMPKPVRLTAVEYPHGGFPNTSAFTRAMGMYSGGKHKEYAKYFLAFLKSEDYNMGIVKESDAFPSDPKYMETREFQKPAAWPNEWPMIENLSKMAGTIAMSRDNSPFCIAATAMRLAHRKLNLYGGSSKLLPVDEAVKQANDVINSEIEKYLAKRPEKRPAYTAALERQKKIDAAKLAGKKIPLALVDNPFLKRYYREMGLGE